MKPTGAVRMSTLMPAEIATVYREAAKTSGKSVSQVVREALEDHLVATQAETTVTEALEKGHPHAAIAAYYRLAKIMSDAALKAMTEAAVLDMDVRGVIVRRMTEQLAAQQQTSAPRAVQGARRTITSEDFLAIEETVSRTAAAIRAQLADAEIK